MKPAPFEYFSPASLQETLALLRQYAEDAKLLAGGQSLVPLMNLRLAAPGVIVDLNRVADLGYIREEGDRLMVGAMARHHDLATSVIARRACPMLAFAAGLIGYPAIRYRGTLGGSLAHADPVSELPCIAVTLDAEFVLAGPQGERVVPAREFFHGLFTTDLAPDEVLVQSRYPQIGPGGGWDFQEFARKAGDFAVAAVAVDLRLEGGVVRRARLGMAGAGGRPVRGTEAEQILLASAAEPDRVDAAAEAVAAEVRPVGDAHAGAGYRRHLFAVLARRAINGALLRARQDETGTPAAANGRAER